MKGKCWNQQQSASTVVVSFGYMGHYNHSVWCFKQTSPPPTGLSIYGG